MTGPAVPTPWDVAKRMRAEGHAREAIVEKLKTMGLDPSDIDVLLKDAPSRPTGNDDDGTADLLRIGAVVVGGPLLGGLVASQIGNSGAPVDDGPLAPLQPLDKADPAPRCGRHPDFASVGACPRCGAFTCRDCAPRRGVAWCIACELQPSLRLEQVKVAARRVAWVLFGSAIGTVGMTLLAAITARGKPGIETFALMLAGGVILSVPFIVLGGLQRRFTHWWPSAIGAVYGLGGTLLDVGCMTVPMAIAIGGGLIYLNSVRDRVLRPSAPPAAP